VEGFKPSGKGGTLSLYGGDTGQASTATDGGDVVLKGGQNFYGTAGSVSASGSNAIASNYLETVAMLH
jgi:hypothetical protein